MNNLNPKIFKAYDIRGVYKEELNEENITEIIKGIYSYLVVDKKKDRLELVLSRDMRISSPSLFEISKNTLVSLGAKVIDIGLSATPTMYFAVRKLNSDAGIQISASHNPSQYNGLKIVKNTQKGLIKVGKGTGMDEVKDIALNKKFVDDKKGGIVVKREDILKMEIENAIKIVNPGEIKPLKIVADTANSMGVLYLKELFSKITGMLIVINEKLDGSFPSHQPDPLQFETLKDLQKKVLEEKADLGIAPDGDADRTFFVDENGKIISASLITALLIRELLKKYPSEKVVCDIRYLLNARSSAKKYGGELITSKVGHALITDTMYREDALFAGESSGHYYFRATGYAESSATVVLALLDIISKENKPISKILKEVQTSYESGEINFKLEDVEKAKPIIEELLNGYKSGQANRLDGLAVDYPQFRFSVRTSNTEPLLRLNVEAENDGLMLEKKKELVGKIISLGGEIKE